MVALVDVFAPNYVYENIGVYRLYAYLESKGIAVKVFHVFSNQPKKEQENLIKSLSDFDMVGFSIYHSSVEYVTQICKGIKENNSKCYIVLGSKFATNIPEKLLDEITDIDAISLGDGEYALEWIYKCIINENLDKICENNTIMTRNDRMNKVSCNININEIPRPKRNIDIIRKVSYATILTTNKCIGQCSFCVTKTYKNSNCIYIRSADDFVDELNEIYLKSGNRFFFIADGSFEDPGIIGKEKIRDYVFALQKNKTEYAFVAYVKAGSFKTKEDMELLKLMRSVGFNQLFIGIESGNRDDLILYNKQASLEDNYNIIQMTKECGIHPIIGFINFNPYTTPEGLKFNYDFLQFAKIFQLSRYIIHLGVYLNTPIYHKLKSESILNESYSYNNVYGYNFINPVIRDLSDFVKNNFLNHPIYQEEAKLFNFMHYYYSQEVLNPDITIMYKEKWQEITARLFDLNSNYFKKLYIDLDLNYAIKHYKEFTRSLYLTYKDIEKLKIQLMKRILR